MADSMAEYLRRDMECEGLLECIHGLKELDREIFAELTQADGALTVDEVAELVDRERSTAYRAIQRLLQTGFIQKEQVNYDHGGYYHVYRPTDPEEIADDMQALLNEWYAKIGNLIHEFRKKYAEELDRPVEASS